MASKQVIWLIWEMQIVDIGTTKYQYQNLRVIASTKELAEIYLEMFERDRKNRPTCATKETWFNVEEREVDHALGFQDANRFVSRNRNLYHV